jgi:hypothetical protein
LRHQDRGSGIRDVPQVDPALRGSSAAGLVVEDQEVALESGRVDAHHLRFVMESMRRSEVERQGGRSPRIPDVDGVEAAAARAAVRAGRQVRESLVHGKVADLVVRDRPKRLELRHDLYVLRRRRQVAGI